MEKNLDPIYLAGNNHLTMSIAVCLLQAGHPVILHTVDKLRAYARIQLHLNDMKNEKTGAVPGEALQIIDRVPNPIDTKLAIIITKEESKNKKDFIHQIEQNTQQDTIITINTESIDLDILQEGCEHPERIMGVNWVEPAHTTFFLELVTNKRVKPEYIDKLNYLSKNHWQKDPYIASGGYSIRSRILAAMAREAFYLVQNGYASVEDIDRACRNDAGYYSPFCGNCRYMDLMGTYAYGVVMKELNPDLSTSNSTPDFFNKIIADGGLGLENGKGFYQYSEKDIKSWDKLYRRFSYQIRKIMKAYPFNYKKDVVLSENTSIENQHG